MSFEGVKLNKLNGGLGGENSTEDNVLALVYAVAAANLPAGKLHHTPYELNQVSDAVALGVNAAYDANKDLLVYHAISEFFRIAPDARLFLIFTPIAAPSVILGNADFKGALREAKDVKGLGIAGIAETVVELDNDIEGVQSVVEAFRAEHRLIDFVVITGKGTAIATAIADYPDLRELNAPNISVSIAQDPAIAVLDAAYAKYADIGAVLGGLAVRQVNENLGSVNIIKKPSAKKGDQDYPLTDGGVKRWLTASLSDGTKVSVLSPADKKNLTTKGYIFAGSYDGYGGVFFNSSPTSVELESDYSYIERNRVWNKAARLIRNTLIPEVKGVVQKDAASGYIKTTTIARWSGLLAKALERMVTAEEISGFSVYIPAKQILSANSPLMVKAKIVTDDIVHEFEVDLGLTKTA